MMDAGIPLSAHVAGIAMGLIKDGNKFSVLTDILGMRIIWEIWILKLLVRKLA